MNQTQLGKSYEKYLLDVKGLKESSVRHYFVALNTISKILKEMDVIKDNIFEIEELETLYDVKHILETSPEYIEMNNRGNRMYSSGLSNYLQFTNGEVFAGKDELEELDMPQKKREMAVEKLSAKWKHSGIVRVQAIKAANHTCEMDGSHTTFIAERDKKPYAEGHHIIPMKRQDAFEYSLDVYANIICLCPLCHRKIHYGISEEREEMYKVIYYNRYDRLAKSGLKISVDDMKTLCM